MTGPPIEEVGPAPVFKAASDGEHGVGARLRPTAHRQFEPVPDDSIAGDFHAAGSDRQIELPAEAAAHPVPVGLVVADAGRGGLEPTAAVTIATPERRTRAKRETESSQENERHPRTRNVTMDAADHLMILDPSPDRSPIQQAFLELGHLV